MSASKSTIKTDETKEMKRGKVSISKVYSLIKADRMATGRRYLLLPGDHVIDRMTINGKNIESIKMRAACISQVNPETYTKITGLKKSNLYPEGYGLKEEGKEKPKVHMISDGDRIIPDTNSTVFDMGIQLELNVEDGPKGKIATLYNPRPQLIEVTGTVQLWTMAFTSEGRRIVDEDGNCELVASDFPVFKVIPEIPKNLLQELKDAGEDIPEDMLK